MMRPRMPFLLRLWLVLSRLLALPYALIARRAHRRMGGAPERFAERLGHHGPRLEAPVIWCHAASLGEVSQLRALVADLTRTADQKVLVTTTTVSGADWVAREMPQVLHRFLPIDTPGATARFLNSWQIRAALFVEGDLWPRLVLDSQASGIPCVLLNARHSRSRVRFAGVFSALLKAFSLVTCRSHEIAEGLRTLGVRPEAVHVLPDLRIGLPRLPCPAEQTEPLQTAIATRPRWLAASTHAADEAAVLDAHVAVLAACPDALLLLAPRHPQRASALLDQAQARGLTLAQRSKGDALTDQTQVYLADTLGELGVFFSLAPLVFMGGALGPEGGHTPFEPAQFGTAILSGPNVRNFSDAYAQLQAAGAALLLDSSALGETALRLLQSEEGAQMGAAARAFMAASDAGLETTAALIRDVLATEARSSGVAPAVAKRAEGTGKIA